MILRKTAFAGSGIGPGIIEEYFAWFTMSFPARVADWLETHWVAPAYVGWVLLGLTVFFFAAATNTLAGWLYVMSGVLAALLAVSALLPPANLKGLKLQRRSLRPVSAGETLLVELVIENTGRRPKSMVQLQDHPPAGLSKSGQESPTKAIATLAPGAFERWAYELPASKRGVYTWERVDLRTAAPLGLFWSRRHRSARAIATVYPQILPLRSCPLLDALGQDASRYWQQELNPRPANEGITRALRPYRWGDPIRLIHWRSSARQGDLRVRELEQVTTGHHITIALNTADTWDEESFEQGAIAAASLFMYAVHQQYSVALWTPSSGIQQDQLAVLSTLAAVQPGDTPTATKPSGAVVWLTMGRIPENLAPGSRVIGWRRSSSDTPNTRWIDLKSPLQGQLQALR
ncbi:DUF58 domain-containing protein [filamentous cyanobacterium CCP5]|nr:DUF58 domain-containing protein [filamentous cyanobacterium CCP5]